MSSSVPKLSMICLEVLRAEMDAGKEEQKVKVARKDLQKIMKYYGLSNETPSRSKCIRLEFTDKGSPFKYHGVIELYHYRNVYHLKYIRHAYLKESIHDQHPSFTSRRTFKYKKLIEEIDKMLKFGYGYGYTYQYHTCEAVKLKIVISFPYSGKSFCAQRVKHIHKFDKDVNFYDEEIETMRYINQVKGAITSHINHLLIAETKYFPIRANVI